MPPISHQGLCHPPIAGQTVSGVQGPVSRNAGNVAAIIGQESRNSEATRQSPHGSHAAVAIVPSRSDAVTVVDDSTTSDLAEPNETIPPEVLGLLIYVIHQESIPCISNHLLKYSRFSCQSRDAWVAGITLRSWRVSRRKSTQPVQVVPSEQANDRGLRDRAFLRFKRSVPARTQEFGSFSQKFSDDEPICPPIHLKDVWIEVNGISEDLAFELEMSSAILSTNAFGDFSKCTIVSELLDEIQTKRLVENSRQLWQQFIHQPQTARCLVFFQLLGQLCRQIRPDFELAIAKLSSMMKLDV